MIRYVKEQLTDDNARPPCYDGQVVCWVCMIDAYVIASFWLWCVYCRQIEICVKYSNDSEQIFLLFSQLKLSEKEEPSRSNFQYSKLQEHHLTFSHRLNVA